MYKVMIFLFVLLLIPTDYQSIKLYIIVFILGLFAEWVRRRYGFLLLGLLPLIVFVCYEIYVYL